jgi:hypothetical protein
LESPRPGRTRFFASLEPKTHRVEHNETRPAPPHSTPAIARLHPMRELHSPAVIGDSRRRESFFHTSSPLRGYLGGV